MLSLPENIKSDLNQFGLSPQELIFENKRKGRYNIIASDNGEQYFVKINDPDISEDHTQKFRKELEFYKTTKQSPLYPNYIDSDSNILILENLQVESLRHWIKNYIKYNGEGNDAVSHAFREFITNLKESIEQVYFTSKSIPDSICGEKPRDKNNIELFVSHIASNCSRLFTSGPMNTSRGRIEQKLGFLMRIIYIKFFKNKLFDILIDNPYEPRLEPIHSDLHQDNVLVDDTGEVYIVDWENCRYGFWISDIAFLSATIFALLRNHPTHFELIDDAISEVIIQNDQKAFEVFDWVRSSMKNAISTNRRFHHNPSYYQIIYGYSKVGIQVINMFPSIINKRNNI